VPALGCRRDREKRRGRKIRTRGLGEAESAGGSAGAPLAADSAAVQKPDAATVLLTADSKAPTPLDAMPDRLN